MFFSTICNLGLDHSLPYRYHPKRSYIMHLASSRVVHCSIPVWNTTTSCNVDVCIFDPSGSCNTLGACNFILQLQRLAVPARTNDDNLSQVLANLLVLSCLHACLHTLLLYPGRNASLACVIICFVTQMCFCSPQ